jgi:uncharacterized membrane protein YfcA
MYQGIRMGGIAHAVPLTLVAGIGHWATGAIDWHLMGVLLVGSLPGIVIGSYCAHRAPETALRHHLRPRDQRLG